MLLYFSPFLPQTASAKAISRCYFFTRNLTLFCTRFWRNRFDSEDSVNFHRFLRGRALRVGVGNAKYSEIQKHPWRRCMRSGGCQPTPFSVNPAPVSKGKMGTSKESHLLGVRVPPPHLELTEERGQTPAPKGCIPEPKL